MPMPEEENRHQDAVWSRNHDSDIVTQDADIDASNHQGQGMHSNFDIHLIVQEVRQLPSPSPTPSPRSSTPALEAAPKLSELTSISNGTNGHKYTTSSDKTMASHDTSDVAFASPSPISKTIPSHELHNILEEKPRKPRKLSIAKINGEVLKLSAAEMEELTSAPESLPVASPVKSSSAQPSLAASPIFERRGSQSDHARSDPESSKKAEQQFRTMNPEAFMTVPSVNGDRRFSAETTPSNMVNRRPGFSNRAISTPPASSARTTSYSKASARQTSPRRKTSSRDTRPEPLEINTNSKPSQNGSTHSSTAGPPPSPMPSSMPLPPMSIPTYLQLELSSSRPSPLYIYRPANSDDPYESSKVKFERLLNFLLLPPQLEQVLYFGSLACLDAWLYTFTILPLRFFKALAILIGWWVETLAREGRFVVGFIYHGAGRFWHRQREGRDGTESAARSRSVSRARRPTASTNPSYQSHTGRILEDVSEHLRMDSSRKTSRQGWGRRHRRTKSVPSSLTSNHKADILQGAVIICSCIILMKFDASRMYHGIRGQAAIKLYVIYNALEVFDKLFSALGQDIFECLFSNETLDRDLDGRSRILRPLGMFILALIYNVIHAAALFYQVIALNVAVNSYSNALLTLLMSNQFVEVKGTVFKMFQKDNLFQLTCADVVERFQLWLMLIIIALRNIVEVGGISIVSGDGGAADVLKDATAPLRSNSILPNSFTILPSWSGEVLAPFILVLGSEMLVDWIKHAYISKFNRVQPAVYQRFLDILAKDYYTNAFVNQNLVKRLGLPVIPLSCLFIRSSVQTYHMFLATHVSPPIPSTATELSVESAIPATTAALEHFDTVIWKALGRSTFGVPDPTATNPWYLPSADDAIAAITMLIVFLVAFLVLLACKLVLGMLLLKFARNRYKTMKSREHQTYNTEGKRIGSWGMVEMEEDKRRHIFADDPETLKKLRDKEKIAKEKAAAGVDFSKVSRYEMSAKRIW